MAAAAEPVGAAGAAAELTEAAFNAVEEELAALSIDGVGPDGAALKAGAVVDGWEVFLTLEGVTVLRRRQDALFEYKVVGAIDIAAETFAAMLEDLAYKRAWDKKYVADLKYVREDPKGLNSVVYWQVSFPFPLSNRDYVFRRGVHKTAAGVYVMIDGSVTEESQPERRGVVRVTQYTQKMTLTPLPPNATSNSRCAIRMRYFDDPKGSIPSWLVNMMANKGLPQYFKTLKKAAAGYPDYLAKYRPGHSAPAS